MVSRTPILTTSTWRCEYVNGPGEPCPSHRMKAHPGERCGSRRTKVYRNCPNRTPGTIREAIALCDEHHGWQAP